jgi:hypothetical protein
MERRRKNKRWYRGKNIVFIILIIVVFSVGGAILANLDRVRQLNKMNDVAGEEEEESLGEDDSGIRESSESGSTADIASDSSGALPYRPDREDLDASASSAIESATQGESEDKKKPEPVVRAPEPNEKSEIGDFYDNSVFIGDSITEGFLVYNILDNATILAKKGMSIGKIESCLEEVVQAAPSKIFIMIGINDLNNNMFQQERSLDQYLEFLDHLREKLPDTPVYVELLLPVSKRYEEKGGNITNQKIDSFNNELKTRLGEKSYQYIDLGLSFKDEEGYLNSDMTEDGLHIKGNYYYFWLNLLKENVEAMK